jgi:hypothetical protein
MADNLWRVSLMLEIVARAGSRIKRQCGLALFAGKPLQCLRQDDAGLLDASWRVADGSHIGQSLQVKQVVVACVDQDDFFAQSEAVRPTSFDEERLYIMTWKRLLK